LTVDLFMAKNESGETPLHVAAKHGSLWQVAPEFLTRETLTTAATPPYAPQGVYSTGAGYQVRTETPLHIAARCGHADQIPMEFLTPEFLSIEASGYRQTVLHDLAYSGSLHLVPSIYAESEMWNLGDRIGRTPRDIAREKTQSENYVARKRLEPATNKQMAKLRWFGCTWDTVITKGQASDAIEECVRRFPQLDADYYSRPATEEQLAELVPYLRADGETPDDYAAPGRPLTYGEAKELIQECKMEERAKGEQ
jgi:hypothetical protein